MDTAQLTAADLEQLGVGEINRRLSGYSPREVLRWTLEVFGPDEVVATSSFQTQSVPLLHLIGRTVPELPVVFLDTGFHFPETLKFRDELIEQFGLDVRSVTNELGHEEFRRRHGALYRQDPDLCCHLNKVEPLERVLEYRRAWVTGIRRDQTEARRDTPIVAETDKGDGTLKICPIVEWTSEDIKAYRHRYDLPEHPLTSEGYASIGCAPCTECPSSGAGGERAGRWAGRDKTECGLHVDSGSASGDDEISGPIELEGDPD